MRIYFDMDGTIADLYSVADWEKKLDNMDSSPYAEATPLLDMVRFSELLNELQNNDIKIGIISWSSKTGTQEYKKEVRAAKLNWLKRNLPNVNWDEIHIVKYGTPKHFCCYDNSGILFDDNDSIREKWEKEERHWMLEIFLSVWKFLQVNNKKGRPFLFIFI